MIEIISDENNIVEINSQQSSVVEINTGLKGDAFKFEDLTQDQIDQLKTDSIPTASEIQINTLTALNDTLSATNVQSALEQIETKTIYGGAF